MPTREEIRRGIAHRIEDEADNGYLKHWEEATELLTLDQRWDYLLKIADLIMGDESKQGVVILKEDAPKSWVWWWNWDKAVSEAVEPLIKEE